MSRATYLGMVGGFAINFAFLRNKINIWILAIIFLFDQMFIVLAQLLQGAKANRNISESGARI